MLQTCHAVVADDEPELQRTEAPSQRNLPVPIVDDRVRVRRGVAQIFRHHAQRVDQGRPVGHVEAVGVEVGEHPLVGVEAVAVGQLHAVLHGAELGTERGRARHGRVYVQPQPVLPADLPDGAYRVDGVGRGGAHVGRDEEGCQPRGQVGFDLRAQGVGAQREVRVHGDVAQVVPPDARDHGRLVQRRVGLGRDVRHKVAGRARVVGHVAGLALARRQHGRERRAGRRILNDAAAGCA